MVKITPCQIPTTHDFPSSHWEWGDSPLINFGDGSIYKTSKFHVNDNPVT